MRMKNLTSYFMCCAAFSATAADLYVDCHGNAPYSTIQAAVDAAQSGDTVYVRPGIYDNGGGVDAAEGTNRVHITKSLTLAATSDDPADTVIVGAFDSAEKFGRGPAAVRCVLVQATASDVVVIRGFTIRDGACHASEGVAGDARTYAGGASAESGNVWFADCRFFGNRGVRGGQVRGGTYLRCRFEGGCGAETAAAATLVYCLVTATLPSSESGANYLVGTDVSCINCTFYRNGTKYLASALDEQHALKNCVLAGQDYLTYSAGHIEASHTLFCRQKDSASPIDNADTSRLTSADCIEGKANEQFMAPAFEDWRLVTGSDAIGLGTADALSTLHPPAGLNVYEDYAHGEVPHEGTINAGCVQAVATPAGGRVRVEGLPFVVADQTVYEDLYFHPEAYPTQYQAEISHTSDIGVYRIDCMADGDRRIRYPMPDDTFAFVPPPDTSISMTCSVIRAASVIHVDPTADVGVADGTSERPYATLQDAVGASKSMGLIRAAAGHYRDGGTLADGVSNRVAITKALRLVGAGAERSFIHGAGDPNAPVGANGCGSGAVRCVQAIEGNICVQGFTLVDGHAGLSSAEENPSHNTPMDQGGAVKTGGSCIISDCVISNCVAYRGSAGYGPHLVRCRVTRCSGFGGVRLVEQGRMTSCAVYGCVASGSADGAGGPILLDTCTARQTTLVADSSANQRAVGSQHVAYGCVISGGIAPSASWAWTVRGCFTAPNYYPAADTAGNAPDAATGNIRFADARAHDYRLLATSEAIGHGYYDEATFWKTYEPGLDGTPLLFVDGKPLPGAFQRPVPVLIAPSAIDAGMLSLSGTNAVEEGDTVVVELSDARRPVKGFLVDGNVQPGTRWTYTAPSFGASGGVSVTDVPVFVFGTNWYVNAAMPDDSGDGFTLESAKRTLISICTNDYLMAGDVIHAARGDYTEGAARHSASDAIRARVLVPSGVTVVSDEGPSVTFITGAQATTSCREGTLGCGSDAVRCAVVEADGVLKGFTLRNGYARWLLDGAGGDTQRIDDNYAGGFLGLSPRACLVDCTVVDCIAPRSALAHGGRYERCRLMGDTASVGTGFDGNFQERFGGFYDSVILVSSMFTVDFPLVNCTVRNTSKNLQAGFEQVYLSDTSIQGVTNCVFACQIRNNGGTADGFRPPCSGNIVCTGIAGTQPTDANAARFKVMSIERIAQAYNLETLSFTGAKVAELVDCGVNREEYGNSMDVDGNLRVLNRTIDLGAAEYDWRADFGRALSRSRVSVRTATANVTTNAVSGLELADGDLLELDWMFKVGGTATFNISAAMSEVSVSVDGVRVSPEGSTYSIFGAPGAHRVAIAYSGDGAAVVSAFMDPKIGMAVIIR